jgi:hypothetical protein
VWVSVLDYCESQLLIQEQNPPESAVNNCNKEVDEVLRYACTSFLPRFDRFSQGAETRRSPHLPHLWATAFPEAIFNTGKCIFGDPEAGRVVSLLLVLVASLAGCASEFVKAISFICCGWMRSSISTTTCESLAFGTLFLLEDIILCRDHLQPQQSFVILKDQTRQQNATRCKYHTYFPHAASR